MKIKKLILLSLAAILVLLIVGAGVAYYVKYYKKEEQELTTVFDPWVGYPEIEIPVIRGEGVVKLVLVKFSIRYASEEAIKLSKQKANTLKNALFIQIYGFFDQLDLLQPLNVYSFRKLIYDTANKELGAGMVEDVRLDSAQEKRTRDSGVNVISSSPATSAPKSSSVPSMLQNNEEEKAFDPLDINSLNPNQ